MVLNRGFQLLKAFQWCTHSRTWRITAAYWRLNLSTGTVSNFCHLIRSEKMNSGNFGVGQTESPKMRKGHLAVYVGVAEEDTCRVLIPIYYFNHPLFGELLKEAEKVYGFDHPGGIQIPCRMSELKDVQRKIDAVCGGGSWWMLTAHSRVFSLLTTIHPTASKESHDTAPKVSHASPQRNRNPAENMHKFSKTHLQAKDHKTSVAQN